MFGLNPVEVVVIGAIAVMLYGKRLPDVGRTFGQTIRDLRKQWTSLSKELDISAHLEGRPPAPRRVPRDYVDDPVTTVASPRFDPPPAPDGQAG